MPFLILYYLRDKKLISKFFGSIFYLSLFCVILFLLYLPWFASVKEAFLGIFTQQGRGKDSIYSIIQFFTNNRITSYVYSVFFFVFAYYFMIKIMLQAFRKNNFKITMENTYFSLMFLIFLLLTNVTSWYISWLFIPFAWIKSKHMKNIMAISFFYELTYSIFFLVHSDSYVYNMWVLIIIALCMMIRYIVIKIKQKSLIKSYEN